jgi:endo-alpha-1,4-polygalactosaminidase (GH114 family)
MQIIEREDAEMIAKIPEMLRDINHLVFIIIQNKRPLKMDQRKAQEINSRYSDYLRWITALGQENFFDAVRADTEMSDELKQKWLDLEPVDNE